MFAECQQTHILLSFNKHIHLCKPNFYQKIEHYYYPPKFPYAPSQLIHTSMPLENINILIFSNIDSFA